jgi:NAD(P)H-binding
MLAAALARKGYQVRGTARDARSTAAIEAAGAEAVVADPLRLATLMEAVDGVSAVCWLMGSARGPSDEVAALHDTRLASMVELLVDTHARGFVYEAAGTVDRGLLERGAGIVGRVAAAHDMPAACVACDPSLRDAWVAEMAGAVAGVLDRKR